VVKAERLRQELQASTRFKIERGGLSSRLHELDCTIEAANAGLKFAVADANDAKGLVRWGSNYVLDVPKRR
jgi:hypothetical protein